MKVILIILIIMIGSSPVYSAFHELEQGGARVIGMGQAFTGLADDINTLQVNPAGLMNVDGLICSIGGSLYYPQLDFGSINRGYILSTIPVLTGLLPSYNIHYGTGLSFLTSDYYQEYIFHLGAAYTVNKKIDTGLQIKLLKWSGQVVSIFDKPREDYGSTCLSFDAGMLYHISSTLKLGISILDLNQPDLASDTSAVKDRLPVQYKFGLGYKKEAWAADIDFNYSEENLSQQAGVEYALIRQFIFLRSGFTLYNLSVDGYQINLGASVQTRLWQRLFSFDYGFGYTGIKDSLGIHHIAVTFSF